MNGFITAPQLQNQINKSYIIIAQPLKQPEIIERLKEILKKKFIRLKLRANSMTRCDNFTPLGRFLETGAFSCD